MTMPSDEDRLDRLAVRGHRGDRAPRRLRLRAPRRPGLRRRPGARDRHPRRRPAATTCSDTVDYGNLVAKVKHADRDRPCRPDRDPGPAHRRRLPRGPAGAVGRGDRAQAGRPHRGDVRGRRPDDHPDRDPGGPPVTETPNPQHRRRRHADRRDAPDPPRVLSLGSNLGERLDNLQGAVDALADTPDVWVTARLAGLRDRAGRRPRGLRGLPQRRRARRHHAVRAHAAGPRAGRRGRLRPRAQARPNAPRTLDVDLIVVGDRRADDDDLVLPHPRATSGPSCSRPGSTWSPRPSSPTRARSPTCSPSGRRERDHPPRRPDPRASSDRRRPTVASSRPRRPGTGRGPGRRALRPRPTAGLAVVGALVGLVLGWLLRPVASGSPAPRPRWAGCPCSRSPSWRW